MPAEYPYDLISLIASAYWFGYFLIILPVLGLTETPREQPLTIEEDFNKKHPPKNNVTDISSNSTDKDKEAVMPAE